MNHDHPSPMLLRGAKHPNVHPLLSTSPLDPKLISTVHLLSPPSISVVRLIPLRHLLAHHFSTSSLDPSVPKLISTVYLLSPSTSAVRLMPLRHLLSPSNVAVALRRLPDSRDSLAFFHLTRTFFRIPHPIESYDHLVRVLCVAGLRELAAKVFDEMLAEGHSPDKEVLGVLVLARARAGELDEAVRLVFRVWESGFEIDAFIVNDLVSRLLARDRGTEGIRLFREGLQSPGFRPDTCGFNIVIKGLCKLGDLDDAFKVFESMKRFGCVADPITKSTLIDGLCRAKKVDKGRELLTRFRSGDGSCSPTVVSYTSVISSYFKARRMREAFEVLDEMMMSGIEPNVVTYNVIIDAYGKMGDMASAFSIFEQMKASRCSPDIVTFTSLIDGCCRKGLLDDAMRIWRQIRLNHLWPNAYTFAIVINALCKWNRFSEARSLLTELKSRRHIIAKPFMYNPVIDGFCKAGNLDEAISIQAEMEENRCFPDKVTYTILMIGYCMKGRMSEAIFLFHKMIISGCAPDTVSINCLVSCLLKAGMPTEASRIVGSVSQELPSRKLSSSREIPHVSRRNADVMLAA